MRSFDLILIWFCKNSHVTVLGIKKCKTGLRIWCQMFKFILRLLTANLRKLWNIRDLVHGFCPSDAEDGRSVCVRPAGRLEQMATQQAFRNHRSQSEDSSQRTLFSTPSTRAGNTTRLTNLLSGRPSVGLHANHADIIT